jgi:hypothetical protein
MRWFVLALSLFLASPAWAAVTYDTDTTGTNPASDTTHTFSHTIGTGTNVYVGVCVTTKGGSAGVGIDVTDVDIGGVQGSERRAQVTSADIKVEYWDAVLGSTTGSVDVVVTTAANDVFRATAFSMFGVDQSSPVGTADSTFSASATSLSLNISSAVGELVISCLATGNGTSNITVGADQTQQWLNTVDANNTFEQGSTEPGASTVTMSHSWTTSNQSVLVAVPVNAASTRRPIAPIMLQ